MSKSLVCEHVKKAMGRRVLLRQSSRSHVLIPIPSFLGHFTSSQIAQNCLAGVEFLSLLPSCTHKASAAQGRVRQDHGLCGEALA